MMTADQLQAIAADFVAKEWARLGIVGTEAARQDEITREHDRLKRAVGVLEAAGCEIVYPGPR